MALATHTITVNAVFLQEIKEDHHELRQLMHHVAAMLDRPTWMKIELDRLVELLAKLRDQVGMHFTLEEAYGYFEDAIGDAPHLNRRAEQLRAQHQGLYSLVCGLVERAEQRLYHESGPLAGPELAECYREFSDRFHAHESRESALILEALSRDIGVGD